MNLESSQEKSSKENTKKLDLFKKEFGKLAEEEKRKRNAGQKYNPHLTEIDVEEFNDEDADIWEKYKGRTLTFGEFSKFRRNVVFRAEKRSERFLPTDDDINILKQYREGKITRDKFFDYWDKANSTVEFLDYWKEKMTDAGEIKKFGNSEENFYAYLDNAIEGDRFWLKKFAEEKPKKEAA